MNEVVGTLLKTLNVTGSNGRIPLFFFRLCELALWLLQAQHYDGNISIPGCDKNSSLFSL